MNKHRKLIIIIATLVIGFVVGWFVRPIFTPLSSTRVYMESLDDRHKLGADQIQKYLEEEVDLPTSRGKMFCEYEEIETERIALLTFTYIYALCIEYTADLEQGSGSGGPMVIISQYSTGKSRQEIITYNRPGDGTLYEEDIKKMFPNPDAVFNFQADPAKGPLDQRVLTRATEHYKR